MRRIHIVCPKCGVRFSWLVTYDAGGFVEDYRCGRCGYSAPLFQLAGWPTAIPNPQCDLCGRVHTTAISELFISKARFPQTAMPDAEFDRLLAESMACLERRGIDPWEIKQARLRERSTRAGLPRWPTTE